MQLNKHRLLGFTLTELMIALVINAFIFLSLVNVFSANVTHYTATLNANRLNQQLQAALQLMTGDIRRAGYWSNARNDVGTNQNNNPYMASGYDISVGGTGNSCILLSYDRNSNGSLPLITSTADDERYGYRLSNQAIQARPWGATYSCTAPATNWENMTDTTIVNITSLTFTLNSKSVAVSGSGNILVRSVDITVTGSLVIDPTVTKTLTQHIKIRNDKYVP